MLKTGVLLHVYHLECEQWERLVWGEPSQDRLGVGTKLFELLLTESVDQEIATIMYSGPSGKDGLAEGEYTRQFLLERLDRLEEFPRFRSLLAHASDEQRAAFHRRVQRISSGELIKNTREEIQHAAAHFQAWGATRVVHIAAASHAPRCIQLQAVVREAGLIPPGQQWFTVTSDLSFAGRTASDTVVVEPPHRADDLLLHFDPMLAGLLKEYYKTLSGAEQKRVNLAVAKELEAIHQTHAKQTELATRTS